MVRKVARRRRGARRQVDQPAAAPLLHPIERLQQQVGNRTVQALLHDQAALMQRSPLIQRIVHERYLRQWQDAVNLGVLSNGEVQRLREYVQDLQGNADKAVLDLVSLSNWFTKLFKSTERKRKIQGLIWKKLLDTNFDIQATELFRNQLATLETDPLNQAVDVGKLHQLDDVLYSEPPLNEAQGRDLLRRIVGMDQTVMNDLAQLRGDHPTYGMMELFEAPWQHEWGLGRVKGGTEAVLIVGDRTGVAWGPYLPYVDALAHMHPMFGKTPRQDRVDLSTKRLPGAVDFQDLIGRRGAHGETMKIFPSASDVQFTAERNLPSHSVFTPYVYDSGNVALNNPQDQTPLQAPRIEFKIKNAVPDQQQGVFTCRLEIWADQQMLIALDPVTADTTSGGGALGTLRW